MLESCLLVVTCLTCLYIVYRRLSDRFGRNSITSPVFVFILGIFLRYGLGSFLVSIADEDSLLPGEFSQYIMTWRYIGTSASMWLLYLVGVCTAYIVIIATETLYLGRRGLNQKRKKCKINARGVEISRLRTLTIFLLTFFLVGSVVGFWTGVADRGGWYSSWADNSFVPTSLFTSVVRLKYLALAVVPLCMRNANRWMKGLLAVLVTVPICTAIINGARGEAMYPLFIMWFGWLVTSFSIKKPIGAIIALTLAATLIVPYMAAYRDSPVTSEVHYRDIGGRVKGLMNGVDKELVSYRLRALSREVYACSDGFVYDRFADSEKAGFEDIDIEQFKRVIIPRIVSGDRRVAKNDGSEIARKLMGAEQHVSWFPCITTPADLYRRSGSIAVLLGGMLGGLIVSGLQLSWERVIRDGQSVGEILWMFFPATYLQYGIYGTVNENLWLLLWELPKYIVLIWIIAFVVSLQSKKRE